MYVQESERRQQLNSARKAQPSRSVTCYKAYLAQRRRTMETAVQPIRTAAATLLDVMVLSVALPFPTTSRQAAHF